MKKWERAEVTVEAAIVIPIVLFVIAGLLYMTLYVHDIVTLRSGAYSAGIEYVFVEDKEEGAVMARIRELPLFVVKPQVIIKNEIEGYVIHINVRAKGNVKFISDIINSGEEQKVYISKRISTEVLYGSKALMEGIKDKRGR
ncbi:TadE family protein [uncultured Eubacterium sp.]|uniref:TadE family protein n=1 Tax=uncultured Eubacterium sp. TaxID=165185 RepID=UPI0026728748|nr:TadE family protein [uncultured Eubacterium sp.]